MRCPVCKGDLVVQNSYRELSATVIGLPENWKNDYVFGGYCLNSHQGANFILIKDVWYVYNVWGSPDWTKLKIEPLKPRKGKLIGGFPIQ